MTDFSDLVIRCHALGALMTNQPGKKDTKTVEELSVTAKDALLEIYVREVYGRDKAFSSKYTEKGLVVEEDSITLLSVVKERMFLKNSERLTNEFFSGEPDIISPLYDLKSCWDIHTFYAAKTKPLNKDYYWQIMGYMDLTGEKVGTVAFTLIDTPLGFIEDEKRRLFYKMNVATMENPDYLAACERLEKEMTFGDIPQVERLHEIEVVRDDEAVDAARRRVELAREWLNRFAEKQQKQTVEV